MIVFTVPVLIPVLIATGLYYGCGLFLSDLNALGVACMLASVVSVLMEFGGTRGTIFFIPAAAWMGVICVNRAFGLTSLALIDPTSTPGTAFMITAILGVLSIVGIFAGKAGEEVSA